VIPIFVFARMSSSRLPGKALRPIAGRPMLAHVIARCARARAAGPVVVATSARPEDAPLAALAAENGARAFAGDLDDVAARALACARSLDAADFVRISGDSPFVDPELIDRAVSVHARAGADVTTNTVPRSCPPGLSVEVVRTAALARALDGDATPEEREHVTAWFYRPGGAARVESFAPETPYPPGVRLVVDTEADLARAEAIAARLPPPVELASARLAAEICAAL
jgi:spore coat polysaccharide biosynthesis protein SpsF